MGVGRVGRLRSCFGDYPEAALELPLKQRYHILDGSVQLRVDVDHSAQQFYYRQAGDWTAIGPPRDAALISDQAGPWFVYKKVHSDMAGLAI